MCLGKVTDAGRANLTGLARLEVLNLGRGAAQVHHSGSDLFFSGLPGQIHRRGMLRASFNGVPEVW